MKFNVYAIKDELTGFATPTFEVSDQVAVRNFDYAVNAQKGILNFKPDEFSIWKIGTYDTETGQLEAANPEMLLRASSVKNGDTE